MLGHMSTTRTATRLIVAASLLLVLILSIVPVGAAAAGGEAPRVTGSDLTLQRVDRTGAAVDGGLTLWSNARLGDNFSALGAGGAKPLTMPVAGRDVELDGANLTPKPEPTPSVETSQLAQTGVTVSGALIAVLALVSTGLLARSHRRR